MLILCLSFGVTVLDQFVKHLVGRHFGVGERAAIIPGFFSLSHVRNSGAAWGMFSGFTNWLGVLSVVVLIVLVVFRRSFMSESLTHRIAAGLMIAGIAGNLIDRVRLGYVVDFLDFYWRQHHFPAFNVADSAICIGVGLYLLTQVAGRRQGAGGG